MGLELRLQTQLKLTQKLVMTQHLQLAIKLLQLNKLELQDRITQELEENPLLDDAIQLPTTEPAPETPEKAEPEKEVIELNEAPDPMEEFNWEAALEDRAEVGFSFSEAKEAIAYENIIKKSETLSDHLLWQLSVSSLGERDQVTGHQIIGNLDEHGFLDATIGEIAAIESVPEREVERILGVVQRFDPAGIASRNLQESLRIQIEMLEGIDDLARGQVCKLVEQFFSALGTKNYGVIAKKMCLPIERVMELVEIVRSLEPYPSRGWGTDPPHYITPDVYITKMDGEYQVLLNDDGLPKLRISNIYRRLLKAKNSTSSDTKKYLKSKLDSALWLIKSIDQRQRTIHKVASSILKFQKDFFDHGIEYLRPLVLKDVAEDIEMHESTVSRASTNKYIHTPQGLFEIKYFFHSGVKSRNGSDVSSRMVKERIRKLIEAEDKRRPLSDQRLVRDLKGTGIHIARRTVAKYREELRIPSSQKRKERY